MARHELTTVRATKILGVDFKRSRTRDWKKSIRAA